MIDISQFEQDAATLPSDGALYTISALVAEYKAKWLALIRADGVVEALEKEIKDLVERRLPDAMSVAGTAAFKTAEDGTSVEVNTEYFANISKERQQTAHQWLRDHNHGSLIKTEISVPFGKGEDERAQEFRTKLDAEGVIYEDKEGVHWSTLKAFVKEQITKGADIPRDVFGIHETPVAKVKPPQALPKRKEKK